MNDSDKEFMRELVKEMTQVQQPATHANYQNGNFAVTKSFMDQVMKVALVMCSAGIMYLISTTITLQRDIALLGQSQQQMQSDMTDVKEFMKAPRFSKEDYTILEKPQNDTLTQIKAEMSVRSQWMDKTDDAITELKAQTQMIARDIEEIKNAVTR